MIQAFFRIVVFIYLASLSACSFFEPHKVVVQQGNVVTQKMIDQLKPGMTKRQVKYVLGTPLVVDAFNSRQWHYNYSLHLGTQLLTERQLTLHFAEGKLASFEGDFKPSDTSTDTDTDTEDAPNLNTNPQLANSDPAPIP